MKTIRLLSLPIILKRTFSSFRVLSLFHISHEREFQSKCLLNRSGINGSVRKRFVNTDDPAR